MEAKFNLKGAERKKLAQAVSELLEAQLSYRGAPTFAYECGGYAVDKAGTLTGPDNRGLLADLEGLYSIIPAEKRYDAEITESSVSDNGNGRSHSPDSDYYANGPETDDADKTGVLTISMPLEGFTNETLANLEKLVASKAPLIMKAIGADALPILREGGALRFPWFPVTASGDETAAYSQLVSALCAMAKTQKRVNAKEKAVENEKFAFRVFLIRLGFIGSEHKTSRKVLLRNLNGNSAFKNGAPQKEAAADE